MKKTDLTKNTILLSIGTLLTKGLQFIMIPFFSSWLSASDYGTFDIICTYVTLLIPIVSFATTDSIFRFSIDSEKNHEEKGKYITNGFLLYFFNIFLCSIILIAVKVLCGWSLAIPFLFLLIGEVFNDFFQGYMRGLKKLNIYSACMAITTFLIALFTTIFLKGFEFGLEGIIYGYALGYIIGNLFIFLITKFWTYFSFQFFSFACIKQMICYSYPLVFNNISWWIVNASDRSIIRYFLDASLNGVYAIANKVPSLCSSVFGMFSISWQQTASEMTDSKERNQYFNEVFNRSIATLISLCAGILSLNFILFNFIFDVKYDAARFQVPILIFSVMFYSVSQFLGGIQISFKRPKENGITTVVGAIVNIVINILLIRHIGLYAASLSTLISNIVLVWLRKKRLAKKVPLKLEKYNMIFALYFIYMFGVQYVHLPLMVSLLNIVLAICFFVYINRGFILKVKNKLLRH